MSPERASEIMWAVVLVACIPLAVAILLKMLGEWLNEIDKADGNAEFSDESYSDDRLNRSVADYQLRQCRDRVSKLYKGGSDGPNAS